MTAALFDEPLNVDDVAPLISGISLQSIRFLQCAIVMCGMQSRWEASLDQVARMVTQWGAAKEDDADLYRLLAGLGLRAGQHCNPAHSRAMFSSRHSHLEIGRINFLAMEIMRTKPRWYPLNFPLTPEERAHNLRFVRHRL